MTQTIKAWSEDWPIAGGFTISRGTKTQATVVVAEICQDGATGRGECVPYARYGETVDGVQAAIDGFAVSQQGKLTRALLAEAMPAGAARNALDCALWDLEAKQTGRSAAELAGIDTMQTVTTAFTLSLGSPETMGEAAAGAADRPLLKVKLGSDGDPERIAAVRANAPNSRLIIDANEGWNADNFAANMAACVDAGVELIEQPLPADNDALLAKIDRPVTVCADESLHVTADLDRLADRYDAVNIKLDKTGGLTEALVLARAARERGYTIMVGCMLGTSLGMAPATLVAQLAEIVDLDGPLLLARDRQPGLVFNGSEIDPPSPDLWG